jgi:hypothetical protein
MSIDAAGRRKNAPGRIAATRWNIERVARRTSSITAWSSSPWSLTAGRGWPNGPDSGDKNRLPNRAFARPPNRRLEALKNTPKILFIQ